jgi:hypothetical protein
MSTVVTTYLLYVMISVLLTAWVSRTLSRHGGIFLAEVFGGDDRTAEAVNHLLVVGFWLINLGYVAFALRISGDVPDGRAAVEGLSGKLGGVLLVLGVMHFGNLLALSRIRRHNRRGRQAPSQVPGHPGPWSPQTAAAGQWAQPAPAAPATYQP